MIRQMLTCHWTARRIQRYLDNDPVAPLTPGEITRLRAHVETCARCSEVMREHRLLRRTMALWPQQRPLDPASVDRMRTVLNELIEGRRS